MVKHEIVLTLGPTKTSWFHLAILDPGDIDDAANSLQSFGHKQRKLEYNDQSSRRSRLTVQRRISSPSSHLWVSGISAADSLSSGKVSKIIMPHVSPWYEQMISRTLGFDKYRRMVGSITAIASGSENPVGFIVGTIVVGLCSPSGFTRCIESRKYHPPYNIRIVHQ